MRCASAAFLALLTLAGCKAEQVDVDRPASARDFPRAYRPVSPLGGNQFATEAQREKLNEAKVVMDLANIGAGTTVVAVGMGVGQAVSATGSHGTRRSLRVLSPPTTITVVSSTW